jgi:protein-disulfide isomerase
MPLKPPPAPLLKPPLGDRDHIVGLPEAKIELVEYGDFECAHCGRAFLIVNQLRTDVGGTLRFAYRHFPLAKMHPHARKAAEAAEAAGAQGKFWEMHDALFKHAPELELPQLIEYAQELGLDISKFETELVSGAYAARVQEDLTSGVRSGVNGTPTFFINGKRHNGSYDYDSLRTAMDLAL